MTSYIARDNIPVGGVLAYTRGQRVEADAVKANGWEDLVVGADTKEAREIHRSLGVAVDEPEQTTTGRRAATGEKREG